MRSPVVLALDGLPAAVRLLAGVVAEPTRSALTVAVAVYPVRAAAVGGMTRSA